MFGFRVCAAVAMLLALSLCPFTGDAATLVTASADGGGQRVASASYTMDGSVGGIGGIATVAAPAGMNAAGYVGQFTEVGGVALSALPAQVGETGTAQLGGAASLDDGSVTLLGGTDVTWGAVAWPSHAIGPDGVATTETVYADTPAALAGSYLGVAGSGSLLVVDTMPDNFGTYAGDGLPDNWQFQYFGLGNPHAAPGYDASGTGQNNLFKYTADLDPTNPASFFAIVAVTNRPPNRSVAVSATSARRFYRLMYATNLAAGTWNPLPDPSCTPGVAGGMTLCDTNGAAVRFYRVQVVSP